MAITQGSVIPAVATPVKAGTTLQQGSSFTDTQGRTGIVNYDTQNGKPLVAGGSTTALGAGGTVIPNVSSAVSAAVVGSGLYDSTKKVDQTSISGSPSTLMNQSIGSTLSTASSALTTTPPANYAPATAGSTPTFGTQGQSVSDLQQNLNTQAQTLGLKLQPLKIDGKYGPATQAMTQAIANASTGGGTKDAPTGPTTDPKTGNITYPNGKILDSTGKTIFDPAKTGNAPTPISVQTDSTGGSTTTYDNGTTSYSPPAPEVAIAYTQANAATATENATYENAVSTAQMQLKEQIDQNNTDKTNAMSAAEMAYDTNNPEGSGSDKAQYMSSISAKYDKVNSQLTENAQNNLTQLNIAHNASLQNIQGQLSTAVQTSKANILTTATANFKDYLAGLKSGDGTMPSGPEVMDAIGTAMQAGKTFEQAKSEIGGALAYAARVQQKADTAEAHTAFMEQATLITQARQEEALNLAYAKADPGSDINQSKYANEYLTKIRTTLFGSRTGDIGVGNLRISNAIKAQQVINDNTDPVTGDINLSKTQYGDLVIAAASLLSSTGNPTVTEQQALIQNTLGSKAADSMNFITGQANTVPTQSVVKNLIKTIQSNGLAAEETRNTAIDSAIGTLANPELDPNMKNTIDSGIKVNSFRQFLNSGIASQNWVTGQPDARVTTNSTTNTNTTVPEGYYQASDGLYYKK